MKFLRLLIGLHVQLLAGAISGCDIQICCLPLARTSHVSLKTNPIQSCTRNFVLPNRPFPSKANKRVSAKFSNQFLNDYTNVEATPPESLNLEVPPLSPEDRHRNLQTKRH
ncbi:PREDICTED: pre translocase subunit SCY2 chloroplastic [Prunus dulcis]|uniref:PREDICTED: pre translocase subunit SCY2 chloroplastic n=1 Tax=Prunus dulcis TaxID=3755 RepID=A0A5E4EET9_PRUDU|nr:PREDICTED: pre translocase subunit SCY2 chloroplastic [Prunus dulcis]